ncbi:MAG: hypothetical protein ACNFW9_03905 [Candidatus Kerfeldbacteria bacterium]|jgi:hypothetical protein
MSEEELKALLNKNIVISEQIFQSLEKQRKIRMWTLIIGIAVIILPMIAAVFMVPWFMNTMDSYYGDLLNF